ERKHLAAGHVLEVVGEGLQVAVVAEPRAEGVLVVAVELPDLRAEVPEARLDLAPLAGEPLVELEVALVVRVGELVAEKEVAVLARVVERVPGRVRPPVLHRLQHPRDLVADGVLRAVAVDDSGDPAHQGSTSRYSATSQSDTVAQ